jgi:ABC-type multidrug transport system fused ATPase/permease subunit
MRNSLTNLLYQPLVFVTAFVYLLFINWKMLMVSVIVIPTFIYLANYISKKIGASTEQYQQNMGEISSSVKQTVDGIDVIHAYGLHGYMAEVFHKRLAESLDLHMNIEKRRSILPGISMVLQAVPYVITILYGGYLTLHQEITPGELLVFIYLLKYLTRPPVMIPSLLSSLRQAAAASNRMFELLDVPEEWSTKSPGAHAIPESCAVVLDRVTFQYDDGMPVFQDFQLQIEKNKMVAIVGPSGCGKSTLAKLICGLYEPLKGTVSVFGQELTRDTYPSIRKQVSYMAQETHLFPATIFRNIQYGRLSSSKEEIAAAAEAAYATEFISGLQCGFDTKVSENGGNLSGGQKQRLGLARVLVKDSKIVILDEPTSALDRISEEYFQQSIAELKGNRTIIVVAHRLPTIRKADEILVMDKGKIVSRGTHDQLLQICGLYSRLYSSYT